MRPPSPVPCTWNRSTPFSLAILATTGEIKPRFRSRPACAGTPAGAGLTGCSASGFAACSGVRGASGCAASGSAASCASWADSLSIHARISPILTVAPSPTKISVKTPLAGLGISVSTLSVLISSSGSNSSTRSPLAFSQRVMVPSKTNSPSWGMTTWMGMHSSPSVKASLSKKSSIHTAPGRSAGPPRASSRRPGQRPARRLV